MKRKYARVTDRSGRVIGLWIDDEIMARIQDHNPKPRTRDEAALGLRRLFINQKRLIQFMQENFLIEPLEFVKSDDFRAVKNPAGQKYEADMEGGYYIMFGPSLAPCEIQP